MKKSRFVDELLVGIMALVLVQHYAPKVDDLTPEAPGQGMRVLMVYESSKKSTWPSEQAAAFDSTEIIKYLDSHCGKEKTGNPGWRKFDEDTQNRGDLKLYEDMLDRKDRKSLPWLYIDKGTRHYSDKFPENTETLKKVLESYGGK